MPLDIAREISLLKQVNPDLGEYIGNALKKIESSVNHLGQQAAVNPTGNFDKAAIVQQLNVKTDGNGLVHATIDDTNEIQKNLHYFVEYANDPSFAKSHVAHLGVSRTMRPTTLPAFDDDGNPQKWYFRAYSQYPGGHPSDPVHFGGSVPTAVEVGGTAKMTLLASTGSGTGSNDGQNIGVGFGKDLYRTKVTK